MKISYNWLKQFLDIDWKPEKTAELLTDLGLEVEGIDAFESVKGGLKGVVVGYVKEVVKHPNADKLNLTQVDIGSNEVLQIVCGAPNVAAGQKVPVATIGTTLYTPEGEAWMIKKSKIRGEVSMGMICAEDELGLGSSHDGIMVLEESIPVGTPCSEIFTVENDTVFEIGLTPNRADAMSHFGVARDLKAGLLQKEITKELITPSVSNFSVHNRSLRIDIEVEESGLAPRYCGVTLTNLIVQTSPDWLKNRLLAIGLQPINNVVDATNFVLHELGQPLHAFDADRIFGKKVVVKKVVAGTKFMTLDGEERILHEDDLMICDQEKPMCIAGVFGGINTGVTENTRNIFLESAYFDPVSIRKTAKRHGLNTDASFRFERGIDINNVEYALMRAAILIRDIAGGDISSDISDFFPVKKEDHQVFLTFEKINTLIGQEIPRDQIKAILTSLEIKVKSVTESGLGLAIPSYRVDVQREVDVIEEILRVYGYNRIENPDKFTASILPPKGIPAHEIENILANTLVSNGFHEILGNSLIPQKRHELLHDGNKSEVTVLNPLSQELSVLRKHMIFTGLEAVLHNRNRKKNDLKLFEFGQVYRKQGEGYQEQFQLSLLVSGNRFGNNWMTSHQTAGFFYLKGVLEMLLEKAGISEWKEQPLEDPLFEEGIQLSLDKSPLGTLGVVSKDVLSQYDIKQEVVAVTLEFEVLSQWISNNSHALTYKEVSKFPEVSRDLALLLDEEITYQDLHKTAFQAERKLLKKVNLFDVYTGKNLPKGKKSYALNFILQDSEKTLTDKKIDGVMQKLQKNFQKDYGAEIR